MSSPSTSNERDEESSTFSFIQCSGSKAFRHGLFVLLVVAVLLDVFDDWQSWREYLPMMTETTNTWSSSGLGRQVTVKENSTTILDPGHLPFTSMENDKDDTSDLRHDNVEQTRKIERGERSQSLGTKKDNKKNSANVRSPKRTQTAKKDWDSGSQKATLETNTKNNTGYLRNDKKKQRTRNDWNKRVVLLGSRGNDFKPKVGRQLKEDMWLGSHDIEHVSYGGTPILTNPYQLSGEKGDDECEPSAEWQTTFYPTCNAFHELDFVFHEKNNDYDKNGAPTRQRRMVGDYYNTTARQAYFSHDHSMELLGIGTSRDTWKVYKDDKVVVLKTLQQDRDFTSKVYQHQIVDAVSSERLTASPYVLDIYGFCGPHVLNELGKPFNVKNTTMEEKLQYATDLAAGLADTHGIDGTSLPNMVHADLRHNNVMFSLETGILKLSDYNQGYFLGWNPSKEEQCGYKPSFSFWHDRFAAPEECYGAVQTEKTDVYHFGGMLFYLLTEYKPYTFNRDDYYGREDDMSRKVGGTKEWAFPDLPPRFIKSDDPTVKTLKKAIDMCLRFKPKNRSSAQQVYKFLNNALKSQQQE